MDKAPTEYTTAGTLMLIAGCLNVMASFIWAGKMVFSLLFICFAPLYVIPLAIAIAEIVCGTTASGGRPSPRIKLVSIFGLIASVLMLNPITVVLEIVALVHLSRSEVGPWMLEGA